MSDSPTSVTVLKVLKALVWVVYMLATAACIVIGFAFFLLLFNANPTAGFAQFVYGWGLRFAGPFQGMIEPTELSSGGVVAWSALIAVAAYAVLAAIVGSILDAVSRKLYRDTRKPVVGQSTVTTTTPTQDGGVVTTATTAPIIGPSAVEQEEARRQAQAAAEAERVRQEQAAAAQTAAQQSAVAPSESTAADVPEATTGDVPEA